MVHGPQLWGERDAVGVSGEVLRSAALDPYRILAPGREHRRQQLHCFLIVHPILSHIQIDVEKPRSRRGESAWPLLGQLGRYLWIPNPIDAYASLTYTVLLSGADSLSAQERRVRHWTFNTAYRQEPGKEMHVSTLPHFSRPCCC